MNVSRRDFINKATGLAAVAATSNVLAVASTPPEQSSLQHICTEFYLGEMPVNNLVHSINAILKEQWPKHLTLIETKKFRRMLLDKSINVEIQHVVSNGISMELYRPIKIEMPKIEVAPGWYYVDKPSTPKAIACSAPFSVVPLRIRDVINKPFPERMAEFITLCSKAVVKECEFITEYINIPVRFTAPVLEFNCENDVASLYIHNNIMVLHNETKNSK